MRERSEWALALREAGKTYEQIAVAWFKRCGLEDGLTKRQRYDFGRRMMREAKRDEAKDAAVF